MTYTVRQTPAVRAKTLHPPAACQSRRRIRQREGSSPPQKPQDMHRLFLTFIWMQIPDILQGAIGPYMLYRVAQRSLGTRRFKNRNSLLIDFYATLYNHYTTHANTALSNTPIFMKLLSQCRNSCVDTFAQNSGL